MRVPTITLWLSVIALGIVSIFSGDSQTRADLVAQIAFSLAVASWIIADARKRGRRLCYDYDSFVYFAWPVLAPFYLFQTRGARALITLICFAGMWIVALLAGWLLFVLLN